jgi:hypothetical protein
MPVRLPLPARLALDKAIGTGLIDAGWQCATSPCRCGRAGRAGR